MLHPFSEIVWDFWGIFYQFWVILFYARIYLRDFFFFLGGGGIFKDLLPVWSDPFGFWRHFQGFLKGIFSDLLAAWHFQGFLGILYQSEAILLYSWNIYRVLKRDFKGFLGIFGDL